LRAFVRGIADFGGSDPYLIPEETTNRVAAAGLWEALRNGWFMHLETSVLQGGQDDHGFLIVSLWALVPRGSAVA
jgi:hypothetical protein